MLKFTKLEDASRFRAVSDMDLGKGYLMFESFQNSGSSHQKQPKMDCLQGKGGPTCDDQMQILEIYIGFKFD